MHINTRIRPILILMIVFLSGFCSLVYQVAWERVIKINLGGDQISSFIVTSSFILGLGIGAYLFKSSFKQPLKVYAIIELFIAIYAIFSYTTFTEVIDLSNLLVFEFFENYYSRSYTIIISFILLVPPCILIGGTLPIFLDCFISSKNYSSQKIGLIYGINTLGACVGIGSIPTLFFNHIDIPTTLIVVGVFNLLLSTLLYLLHIRNFDPKNLHENSKIELSVLQKESNHKLKILAFFSGGIALLMEIIFFRLASTNWPSSAYNFPMILIIFLFFMSLGSIYFSSLVRDSTLKANKVIFSLFTGLIITIFWIIFIQTSFSTTSIFSIAIKYLLMVGPFAFIQGGIFPIILGLSAKDKSSLTSTTGILYLLNSIGAFSIVLISQFLLIELIGLKGLIMFLAFLCFISLIICISNSENEQRKIFARNFAFILAFFLIFYQSINNKTWNIFIFNEFGENMETSQGPTGIATILWKIDDRLNRVGEVKINSHYMSQLPNHPSHVILEIFGLAASKKDEILALGLGGGGMIRELNREEKIKKITIAEWSQEIISLLSSDNQKLVLDNIMSSPKVEVIQADARQLIKLMKNRSKDIIIDNLAYTYMSGATSVKSVEYFNELSRVLKTDGILILAINARNKIHEKPVIAGVLQSFESVFTYQNTLIASNKSLDCFFQEGNLKKLNMLCPISKSEFVDIYNNHRDLLPEEFYKSDYSVFINKFIERKKEEHEEINPIYDNFPVYEYYLCSFLETSKCIL